jgi:hypothetical protein
MRSDIEQKVSSLLKAAGLANECIADINSLSPAISIDSVDVEDCIENFMKQYFADICSFLSKEYSEGTPASVDIDWMRFIPEDECSQFYDEFRRFNRERATQIKSEESVRQFANAIQFKWIESELTRQVAELKEKGSCIIADRLVAHLGLGGRCSVAVQRYGRIILRFSPADYWRNYQEVRDYSSFEDCLGHVTAETKFDFGSAVTLLKHAIDSLTYDKQQIASRTVFSKGAPLEIVCFKEKYEFRFTPPAFEAITAYIALHGNENSVAAISNFFEQINQNAA